jgi:uncharacterized membrane protein
MLRKPIFILLALGSCVAMPATAAELGGYNCQRVKLTCAGSEPFWSFRLNNGTLRFSDAGNTNGGNPPIVIRACATRLPGNKINITAGAPLGLTATVTHQSCGEPSGATSPYSISISYTQGAVGGTPRQVSGTGCCRK